MGPVFSNVPPVSASNQLMTPVPVAARFTVPPGAQTESSVTEVMDGWFAMVIVKVIGVPTQVPTVGVTVIVPDMGPAVAFVAVKDGISPVPLAARPMDGLEFVQLKVAPGVELVNVIGVVAELAQKYWLATASAVGVGFTTMVSFKVAEQPKFP